MTDCPFLSRCRIHSIARAGAALVFCFCAASAFSQFHADFESSEPITKVDPNEGGGWSWYSGDGEAKVDFLSREGYATMLVDAREDPLNIWWAIVRSRIDSDVDVQSLAEAGNELRIEARVRVSAAPRRINLQLFGPRNRLHEHLAEFDIPIADEWHRVSLTTSGFSAQAGDPLFCQLAMMDWGQEIYATDIDYLRVEVVDASTPLPSYGLPLIYHPPLPDRKSLPQVELVAADAAIDSQHPNTSLNDWGNPELGDDQPRLLPITPSQTALLKWNLSAYAGREAEGTAVLELTTHSLTRLLGDYEELGRLRVVEILGHAPEWDEETVSYQSFTGGSELTSVTNAQTVIDVEINPQPGFLNRIAISQPVMQRLLDGKSKGLALRALGPVNAVLYAHENTPADQVPVLRFALKDPQP